MKVSNEEILHIAKLANLTIEENEIEKYRDNLEEILNFANIINQTNLEGISEEITSTNQVNVFREDKVIEHTDLEGLLQNAPSQDDNMFKIPNVID